MSPLAAAAILCSAIWLAEPAAPITAVAFAPDGSQVLATSQGGVAIHAWPSLERVDSLACKLSQIHDLAFSPDGKLLAIAGGSPGESGAVELWRWPAATRERLLAAGGDVAYRASWNAAGTHLVIAGADKRVRLQAAVSGPPQVWQNDSSAVLAVLWLDADKLILSAGNDQAIRVLDSSTGKPIRTLDNHTAAVRDLAVRPGKHDGPPLVASVGADRTIRFWQPTIGRMVRFTRLASSPTAVAWNANGSQALVACEDGCLRAVDPETLEIAEFAGGLAGWAYAVAASPDGRFALLAGEQAQLRKIALDAIKP